MRSLQWKLTFALLFTSLLSVALVGIIARHLLSSKFNQIAMQQSRDELRDALQNYIATHGSWEKAAQIESFPNFMRRRREAEQGAQPGKAPSAPRFHFMVLAPNGIVLLGPPEMRNRPAPPAVQAEAEPMVVNGQVALKILPTGQPNYTDQDREFLAAMQQALVRGILGATILALALGIFFGQSLSLALRRLTTAIEAMGKGELRQQVEIASDDEVGVLAEAFNRMSSDLSQAHEALQESHAKISQQAAMLKELAVRDGLTKLHNRRFFDERGAHAFAQAKRYNRPLTVMIGDIDFFKKINDNFSHAIGDEVLRHVAAILRKNTRESDIVARYGGEEFVVAFPETELLAAFALCERLRQIIETYPWHTIHADLRVTMSMGLNQDMTLESFERMVAGADARLYQAKESGRNRVCAPLTA
jgi:two-component system, cell cycle response regulator